MLSDRERLIELITQKQNWGQTYEKSIYTRNVSNGELADHLIANGVIVPPCKVEDTIYQIDGVRIYASTIHEITYTSSKVIFVTENIVFDEQAINNSIFLTREEAEKALEERANARQA